MYERMLNYSKPETQSSRGGKSKTTQESGKTFRHGELQREGTGGPDPHGKSQVAICVHRNAGMDIPREAIGPKGSNCFSREVPMALCKICS